MRGRRNFRAAQKLRNTISFVIDGETELWYLQRLKEYHRLTLRFSPELPQKKSLEDQYELVMNNAEVFDKVFWILDLDVIIRESRRFSGAADKSPLSLLKRFVNEIDRNGKGNIYVIANTPGFEYWVLLHFKCTEKYYETCDQVIDEIHKIKGMEGYEKTQKYFKNPGNDIYKRLYPYLDKAVANSKKTGCINFENIETGLSQMCKLFDVLEL